LVGLQNIATKGLKRATSIYNDNSNRPYFKKIDLLCDRLCTDLSVTGKALVNINSHGIAWAIKDFIFVFNRIIGAWCIIRDYFISKDEGMQCVRDALDPNFEKDFLAWQEATAKFSQTLINSFENLNIHNRQLRNGNRKQSNTSTKMKQHENLKIFDPTVIENDEVQLSGSYLKSAVYKPVSSTSISSTCSRATDPTQDSLRHLFGDILKEFETDGNLLFERGLQEQQ
jgi:hypothetical protein